MRLAFEWYKKPCRCNECLCWNSYCNFCTVDQYGCRKTNGTDLPYWCPLEEVDDD